MWGRHAVTGDSCTLVREVAAGCQPFPTACTLPTGPIFQRLVRKGAERTQFWPRLDVSA